MVTLSIQTTWFAALVLGVTSHLGYFIRGEHHLAGPRILATFCTCSVILFAILLRHVDNVTYHDAGQITAAAAGLYLIGLFSSMATYRLLFHRLGSFPGPLYLRLSKWNHTWLLVFTGLQNYKRVDEWHAKYGSYIRYVNAVRLISWL